MEEKKKKLSAEEAQQKYEKKLIKEFSFSRIFFKKTIQLWYFWVLILVLETGLFFYMRNHTGNWGRSLHCIVCSFLGLGTGMDNDATLNVLWPVYVSGVLGILMFGLIIYIIVQSVGEKERIFN